MEISELLKDKKFIVKKPRKDEEKLRLRSRIVDLLGRTPRSVWATTMIWTEDMLQQSIKECQHYTTIQTRNWYFNEYIKKTKVI